MRVLFLASDPEMSDRTPGPFSPWWILAGFALAAAVAGIFRGPAQVTAGILLLFFAGAVARHPANGLAAIVLATPFLLGEQKTPYFPLQHVLVIGVALSFLFHRLSGRVAFIPFYGGAALFFVAAAVIALPLNLRDLIEDLWLFRSLNWSLISVQGVPDISHLKYLDRVGVLGLGAALFAIAAQPPMRGAVVGALGPLAALVALLSAFGLLRFFGVIQTSGQYLTLSFWTWQNPDLRLTAVAWNPDYMAQFLVLAVPLAVALACLDGPGWQRGLAAAAAGLGVVALVFTFQRAAYAALLVALGVQAVLLWRTHPGRVAWTRALVVAGFGVAAAGLDALALEGRVTARLVRFADDPNRLRLWETALRMALDHPLLGVGTGRYAFFFHEYAGELRHGFGPFWGTAHSLYLQLLAEQGLLGLASFLVFFGGVWLGALRRVGRLPADRALPLSGVLAAMAGWFTYGLVQFTFRVDALVYLACILAGTAVALAPPDRWPALPRRVTLAAVAIGLVIVAFRADAALRRPVSPGYDAGFYRWERLADGRAARWTRGRAAMTVPVRGRIMELRFRASIPGVEARPQVVLVRVNHRRTAEVRLTAPDWQTVDVPIQESAASHVLVELEVAYTFVPSRVGGSRDDRTLGVMIGEVTWRDA